MLYVHNILQGLLFYLGIISLILFFVFIAMMAKALRWLFKNPSVIILIVLVIIFIAYVSSIQGDDTSGGKTRYNRGYYDTKH